MPSSPIDLRSDTVTRPTPGMLGAMTCAPLGDDVLGDDPTVIALQERVASILGKEAACFVPSGTMANQLAIRVNTEPGDEIIAHADSHIIHYETGAPAVISGASIRPVAGALGQFDAADVEAAVRPANDHYPRSRLVVVENTHNRGGGAVWALDRIAAVAAAAAKNGLRRHLDGARVWNASVASGETPGAIAAHFDTVSVCFSKGLGAPAGSAIAGDRDTILRARRYRKMLGGAMRQSGLLAAAALYALGHHIERLADDHENARRLAEGLSGVRGLSIPMPVATNMVFVDVSPTLGTAAAFCEALKRDGVLVLPTAPQRLRAVTHLDVPRSAVERAVAVFGSAARQVAA
jgi:threonine aldolase